MFVLNNSTIPPRQKLLFLLLFLIFGFFAYAEDVSLTNVLSARTFEIGDLIHTNFYKASDSVPVGQCVAETLIHRAYAQTRGDLGIHVIPHRAIFHNGIQCGSGKQNEYLLVIPWRHTSTADRSKINDVLIFFDVVGRSAGLKKTLDAIEVRTPISIGVELSGPRTCKGSSVDYSLPNRTVIIFFHPDIEQSNLYFSGIATVYKDEVGMIIRTPVAQTCLYKHTRRLMPGQKVYLTLTPTPSVPATPIVMDESLFDFTNTLGAIFPLFPIVSLDISSPSATPTISDTPSVTPSISVSSSVSSSISPSAIMAAIESPEETSVLAEPLIKPSASLSSSASPTLSPQSSEPGGGNSLLACFPNDARVTILIEGHRKDIAIFELQIGHFVQVAPHRFSRVFASTHNISSLSMKYHFLSLVTTRGFRVTLSHSHYIPVVGGGLKPAGDLSVGQSIYTVDGGHDTILRITAEMKNGLHNPHTEDGQIIVGGIIVSTYTKHIAPRAAVAYLSPLRGMSRAGYTRALGWINQLIKMIQVKN